MVLDEGVGAHCQTLAPFPSLMSLHPGTDVSCARAAADIITAEAASISFMMGSIVKLTGSVRRGLCSISLSVVFQEVPQELRGT